MRVADAALVGLAITLGGCLNQPYTAEYLHVDVPNPVPQPELGSRGCYGKGATPSFFEFEANGVRYGLSLGGPSSKAYVSIGVRKGEKFAIPDRSVVIELNRSSKSVSSSLIGGKVDATGMLIANTSRPAHDFYIFYIDPKPEIGSAGKLKLPNMKIGDTSYTGLTLPFSTRTYFGIAPFNC